MMQGGHCNDRPFGWRPIAAAAAARQEAIPVHVYVHTVIPWYTYVYSYTMVVLEYSSTAYSVHVYVHGTLYRSYRLGKSMHGATVSGNQATFLLHCCPICLGNKPLARGVHFAEHPLLYRYYTVLEYRKFT